MYEVTPEEVDELLKEQGGECPICGETPEVVDHCHTTGRVRGVLCHKCNRGLGHFADSEILLERALGYLAASREKYLQSGTVVPD